MRCRAGCCARGLPTQCARQDLPVNVAGVSQHANFERRQSNSHVSCQLFEELLAQPALKPLELAFGTVHYANFLRSVLKDTARARSTYSDRAAKCRDQMLFWEGWAHFEDHVEGADVAERVLKVLDQASAPPAATQVQPAGKDSVAAESQANGITEAAEVPHLTEAERQTLSSRAVDFADLHCDMITLQRVSGLHYKRFTLPSSLCAAGSPSEPSRKRSAQVPAAAASAAKVAKVAAPSPAPAQASADMTAQYSQAPPAAAAAAASAAYAPQHYGSVWCLPWLCGPAWIWVLWCRVWLLSS